MKFFQFLKDTLNRILRKYQQRRLDRALKRISERFDDLIEMYR
jgi:hypothetical protein